MNDGIPISIERGEMKVGKGASPEVVEAVGLHRRKSRSSRARNRLESKTREFTGGQVGPIMGVDRRDMEKQEAGDNLEHQIAAGKPEEEEVAEAMGDTEKFDIENQIA